MRYRIFQQDNFLQKEEDLVNQEQGLLIKSYKEYAYDSEIIGLIHGILIDNLYEEESNTGLSGIITKKRI
ncbi:uncharacterized protein VNE69_04144 [Vairimorpha necatrix]|uniref:Uncharacterized protein n=1 Tax=Vairimorpha necatrix TaxID=6039 RepID=A0AAX4JBH4_9MICR